jgi:hypothetical protein
MSRYDYDPPDYDFPEFTTLRNTTRTARKPHTCAYCGCVIQPGEKYNSLVMIYEGEFQAHAAHIGGCPLQAERDRIMQEEWERERLASLPIGPDETAF